MSLKPLIIAALVSALASLAPVSPSRAQGAPSDLRAGPLYNFSATTGERALRQGGFQAGALTWRCQHKSCGARGRGAEPSLDACRALAAHVGRLTAYYRVGPIAGDNRRSAPLSSGELAACNAHARHPGPGAPKR